MITSPTSASPILGGSFTPPWFTPLLEDGYRLRRAWPRGTRHLLLEVLDPLGIRVAGQWFDDRDRARKTAAGTPGSRRVGQVVLQPHGADRRLLPLGPLVSGSGHRLVAHRPERRAVVAGEDTYLKIMRPEKFAAVAVGQSLARSLDLGAPEVVSEDREAGILVTRALPGARMTELLGSDAAAATCFRAGRSVARIHSRPVTAGRGLPVHGPEQESAVLRTWKNLSTHYTGRRFAVQAPELPIPDSAATCLLHRDLHDGQMIFSSAHDGILDLDLMAVGDPALDLGNLLAHLELRSEQGLLRIGVGEAEEALLEGYGPSHRVLQALPVYREVARQRLQAVYSLRDAELPS